MTFFKRFIEFYINSYIHVAIAAFCLTKITLIEFGIHKNISPLFVMFATLVSYNFIRYYDVSKINMSFANWVRVYKLELFLLNLVSLIFLILLALKLNSQALFLLIPFALATFFYVVPFIPKNKNLRTISGLKLFLITISWAGVTVLFPIINNDFLLTKDVWITFFQRFLFLFAVTIPFDIRDLKYDIPEMKTIPHIIGIKKSKLLGSFSLLVFYLLDFYRFSIFENSVITTTLITVLSLVLLNLYKENKSKYYTSFWMESLPIIWFLFNLAVDLLK